MILMKIKLRVLLKKTQLINFLIQKEEEEEKKK